MRRRVSRLRLFTGSTRLFFVSVSRVVRNVCTILFHALRVFHSLHQYCVNTKQTKHRRREARGWEVVDDVR